MLEFDRIKFLVSTDIKLLEDRGEVAQANASFAAYLILELEVELLNADLLVDAVKSHNFISFNSYQER